MKIWKILDIITNENNTIIDGINIIYKFSNEVTEKHNCSNFSNTGLDNLKIFNPIKICI